MPIQMPGVLPAGIYRHYKGPLYLVLGLAHDANADTFFDAYEEHQFEGGKRTVVVYIGLQLDAAKEGPRLAVRTLEDFNAIVWACKPGHGHYGDEANFPLDTTCRTERRFTYLGPEYVSGMETPPWPLA